MKLSTAISKSEAKNRNCLRAEIICHFTFFELIHILWYPVWEVLMFLLNLPNAIFAVFYFFLIQE